MAKKFTGYYETMELSSWERSKQKGYTNEQVASKNYAQREYNNFMQGLGSYATGARDFLNSTQHFYPITNIKQATRIRKELSKGFVPSVGKQSEYDMNLDGKLDEKDAKVVEKYAVGLATDNVPLYGGDVSKWIEDTRSKRDTLNTDKNTLKQTYNLNKNKWKSMGMPDEVAKNIESILSDEVSVAFDNAVSIAENYETYREGQRLLNLNVDDAKKERDERRTVRDNLKTFYDDANVDRQRKNNPDNQPLDVYKFDTDLGRAAKQYGWETGENFFDSAGSDIAKRSRDIRLAQIYQIQDEVTSLAKNENNENSALYNEKVNAGKTAIQTSYSEYWDLSYLKEDEKEFVYYLIGDAVYDSDNFLIYNYEKDAKELELVNEYVNSYDEIQNQRQAEEIFARIKDNTLGELSLSGALGTAQFVKGISNLFNDDDYIAPNAADYLSGMIREDLGNDWRIGDWSVAQTAFDVGTTTANMMPSILASAVVTGVTGNPIIGSAVGSTMLGTSAAGNAYAEMLNMGYSKEQSMSYGVMVGVSEAALQYVLGGISGLGGNLSQKAVTAIVNGLDNAIARIAINTGASMLGEFTEEALQEIIDPYLRKAAGMSEYDIEDTDWGQVFYSGLLGALSAGMFEGPSVIASDVNISESGKNIRSSSEAMNQLNSLGNMLNPENDAFYSIRDLGERPSSYQVGKSYAEAGTEISNEISALKKTLINEGYSKDEVRVVEKSLNTLMSGGVLSSEDSEVFDAIESSDVEVKEIADKTRQYGKISSLTQLAYITTQGDKLSKKDERLSEKASKALKKAETALIKAYPELAKVKEESNKENSETTFEDELKAEPRYSTDTTYKKLVDEYVSASKYYTRAITVESIRKGANTGIKDLLKSDEERQKEATTKAKSDAVNLKLSDKGVDILDTTDEAVNIVGVVRDGNSKNLKLKVQTNSGNYRYANVDDVAFSDNAKRAAFSVLHNLPVSEKYMLPLVELVDSSSKVAPELQMYALAEAFTYGELGATTERVKDYSVANRLTDTQLQIAVNYGRTNSERSTSNAQAKVDTKKKMALEEFRADLKHNKNRGKQGKFKHDFSESQIEDMKKNSPQEYEAYKMCEGLSKILPVDIYLIDTRTAKWKDYSDANGFYRNGTVYVDINAGISKENSENLVLFTLSHELVHYIKEWSPAKFKVLADFVINEFMANDVDVKHLIDDRVESLKNVKEYKGYTAEQLQQIAYEELVAEACQRMLVDSKAVEKLTELRKKDKGLFNKLKQFITDFFNKIKARYKNLNPTSIEAKYVQEIEGMSEKLQKLFEDALLDAAENQRIVGANSIANSPAKMEIKKDINGNTFVDVTEDILADAPLGEKLSVTLAKIVSNKFKNRINANGQVININATTNNEWRRSPSAQKLLRKNEFVIYDNKQRALANADELLITARNWVGEKNEHLREDDIAEFARGNIRFRTPDTKCYEADILTATKKTGAVLLYDIINLREIKITEAPTADLSKNSRRISETSVTDESVTQDLTDVNIKFQSKENDVDDTTTRAEAFFGTTYNWKETGYILTNGKRLDFSGKKDGAPAGQRSMDHREIIDGYNEKLQNELSGSEAMIDFMKRGNIRVSPEMDGINLSVMPTKAQESTLRDFITRARGEIVLDIDNEYGDTEVSVEYPRGTSSAKILNDIRQYFEEGIEPSVSNLSQFRYQLKQKESAYDEAVQGYMEKHSRDSLSQMVSIVNEVAELYMPNSKVCNSQGKLIKVYHGTEAGNFNKFDKGRQGQTDSSLWGRGYYFTSEYDFAEMFGDNVRSFFLNITNPFTVSKVDAPASEIADKLMALGEKIDFDYSNLKAHEFAKAFGNQRFSDVLASHGYDGVIVGDVQSGYAEYVAFEQNQMKLSDPVTYDDNGEVIPLSERFDDTKTDIRYQKKVDSNSKLNDNKNINNGGAVNGSKNTELLEQGTVSALGRGYDLVWKQSESARKILGYLGILAGNKTQKVGSTGASDGRWLAPNAYKQQIEKGFADGVLRALRGVSLSGKDVIGRELDNETLDLLKNTVLKDEEGNILSLYHWTQNTFDKFKFGDIGFHFGTVQAAHDRYRMLKEENAEKGINTPVGIYKEVYLNITNPVFMADLGQWSAYDVAVYLERNGLISELQYDRLALTTGFYELSYDNPAINAVRKILSDLGYDGILYYNDTEDTTSVSAIALYPEQVVMVTDNGKPVKNSIASETENGLPRGVLNYQLKSYAVETDSQLLAQHLEENSQAVGEILRRSSEIDMNERTVTRLVSKRLREYGMYGSVLKETSENIALLLEVAKHPSVQGKDVTADLTDAIKSALERTSYEFNPNKEDYDEVVQILKDYGNERVYLTADQEAHVREQGYDIRWLRQRYFGKLNIVKGSQLSDVNEIRLDDVYSDLSERFPNIFPTEDSPSRRAVDSSEYAMDILDKLDYLSQGMSLTIEEAFGEDAQTVATRIMSEVVADVVQSKYNNRKNPYVDSVIEKQRQLNNKRTKERVAKERQKKTEALQKQAEKFAEKNKERYEKAKERRTKTELRQKIKKLEAELRNMVLRPTVKKYVSKELVKDVVEILSVVNMDTVEANRRIAAYDILIKKANANGNYAKAEEYILTRERIKSMGDNIKLRLDAIAANYSKLQSSSDFSSVYDENLHDMFESLSEVVGDTPIRSMSVAQLQKVYETFQGLLTRIRDENTAKVKERKVITSEYSNTIHNQIKKEVGLKPNRKAFVEKFSKYGWSLLKPYYAFENMGSKALMDLYNDLQIGEGKAARNGHNATEFLSDLRTEYNWRKWKHKEIIPINLDSGKQIELTLDQIMFIYNAWKREQYQKHILAGGFVFESGEAFKKIKEDKSSKKSDDKNQNKKTKQKKTLLQYVHTESDTYVLTVDDISKITSNLTKEQTDYADALEQYLTKVMGALGNEVTNELYGFDVFKELHYTPIYCASDFVESQNKPEGKYTLKNMSASKPTNINASNPVVLRNYEDVWLEHVAQMCIYNAFVVPIESFNKVWNYKHFNENGSQDWSTKSVIRSAHGQAAVNYVDNFIRDLNGGVMVDAEYTLAGKLFANSKKVAVAASLSTVVQQPMALIRAMAEIDAKYFFKPQSSNGYSYHVNQFSEIMKYSDVAILKDMGGFDAGGNRSMKNYINGTHTIMGHIDNAVMWGAKTADELAWSNIWVAVINEQQAKYGVKLDKLTGETREKFLKKCGKRFDDVVRKTQVYDSVFSRSAIMRSKNPWAQMITSYMGEPITSLNMLYSAIVQQHRNNITGGKAVRTAAAVYGSIVAASVVASFAYALRDDDDEKSFLEKWVYQFGGKLTDELIPFNMMPFVRDVISLFQGYSVKRPDMAMIEDVVKSINALGSDDKTAWDKFIGIAGSIAAVFGIPVKNVYRDGKAIFNMFDESNSKSTDMENLTDSFRRGLTWKDHKLTAEEKREYLHKYLAAGRLDKVKEYRESFKDKDGIYDDEKFHNEISTMLVENDPRIEQAARAQLSGDAENKARLADEIYKSYSNEFVFHEDVVSAIKSMVNKLDPKENTNSGSVSSEVSYKQSFYTTDDVNMAFNSGNSASARIFITDIVSAKKDEYMVTKKMSDSEAEKAANNYVRSAMTTYWKPLYQDAFISGDNAEMNRIKGYVQSSGVYSDWEKAVKGWEKDLS